MSGIITQVSQIRLQPLTSLYTLGVEKCRITYSKLRENNYKFLFGFKKSNRKSKSESQLVISTKKKSIVSHTSCNKLVRVKLLELAPGSNPMTANNCINPDVDQLGCFQTLETIQKFENCERSTCHLGQSTMSVNIHCSHCHNAFQGSSNFLPLSCQTFIVTTPVCK
jgi:hypothetical protein